MQRFVKIVGRGEKLARDLSRQEAFEAMGVLLAGSGTPAQVGAFLVAMRVKSESAEECAGFALGARELFQPPALAPPGSVDLGAPHDGRVRTAPLTWLSALVSAAAGVAAVASGAPRMPTKHGVGVPEVLRYLGVDPLAAGAAGQETLERLGVAYQPVESWFPSWEALREVREELGLRTLLSTVEKLLNPCRADHAVVGIFHKTYLGRLAEALGQLGLKRAAVIQGPEGGVVPSVRRKTNIAWAIPEEVIEDVIEPAALGLAHLEEPAMPKEPSAVAEGYAAVLESSPEADPAWRDAACLAAGVNIALVRGLSVAEGARRALELLDSGEVARLWESYTALVGQVLPVPK